MLIFLGAETILYAALPPQKKNLPLKLQCSPFAIQNDRNTPKKKKKKIRKKEKSAYFYQIKSFSFLFKQNLGKNLAVFCFSKTLPNEFSFVDPTDHLLICGPCLSHLFSNG
jgi:adenine-specific DNA glycosylase